MKTVVWHIWCRALKEAANIAVMPLAHVLAAYFGNKTVGYLMKQQCGKFFQQIQTITHLKEKKEKQVFWDTTNGLN